MTNGNRIRQMTDEEAIDELKRIRYHGTERLIKALEVAISALESQRWIPVTERLPDLIPCRAGTAYSEAVCVLTEERTVCTAVWNGSFWIADFDFWGDPGNVTHWKTVLPLPLMPKEEQK